MKRLRYLTYVGIFSALLLITGTPAFSADPMDETNVFGSSSRDMSRDISNQGSTNSPQLNPNQPSPAQHSRVETDADMSRKQEAPSTDVRSSESGRAIPEASSKVAPRAGTDVERQSGTIERRTEERQVAPSGTQLESRSGAIERQSGQRQMALLALCNQEPGLNATLARLQRWAPRLPLQLVLLEQKRWVWRSDALSTGRTIVSVFERPPPRHSLRVLGAPRWETELNSRARSVMTAAGHN